MDFTFSLFVVSDSRSLDFESPNDNRTMTPTSGLYLCGHIRLQSSHGFKATTALDIKWLDNQKNWWCQDIQMMYFVSLITSNHMPQYLKTTQNKGKKSHMEEPSW